MPFHARYIPHLLFLMVFSVYLSTMSPVMYLGDSGEFTAAAFSLGIPHNSGYPLYGLLGKIFCMVPMGNVAFRLNLMSAFFSALTVLLVYHIIHAFTRNAWCSLSAAGFLAFTPLFWSQTVSAEVYPLHLFFMALMIWLLCRWEECRDFRRLLLFVFVTGISFTNHMQTVMLAPAVLFFIVSGDRKAIFEWKHFWAITLVFLLPLLLYLYLPIRTQAGAAIHWGDPDNLERFLSHVTARAHRDSYVFSGGSMQYVLRFLEALKVLSLQYGLLLPLSIWGWISLPSLRWKVFFAGIVLFDFFYTVFLNIISLEITPFTLPSSMVMAILLGIGLTRLVVWIRRQEKIGGTLKKGFVGTLCAIPVVALFTNYGVCDQSRNYTAYEQAVNIFRTANGGDTIFLDGDNNVFPAAYGRIVEGMGEGKGLYDRHNIIFKWSAEKDPFDAETATEGFKSFVSDIIHQGKTRNIFLAVFNPHAVSIPEGFALNPVGILQKIVLDNGSKKSDDASDVWRYYATQSLHDSFFRDYMTREVSSFYFLREAENLFSRGRPAEGLWKLRMASTTGYNDTSIHSEIGLFLSDRGFFQAAKSELEKALIHHDDLSGIYNNWGYYFDRRGDYERAIDSFEKAIALKPQNYTYHNNLGLAFHKAGKDAQARNSFKRSLSIHKDQPKIKAYMKARGLE